MSAATDLKNNNPKPNINIWDKFLASKRVKIILAFVVILVAYIVLAQGGYETNAYLITGGIIGALSSAVVILDILWNRRQGAMKLLLWRSVSDLGVAVRFIFTFQFNRYICGQNDCSKFMIPSNGDDDDRYLYNLPSSCGLPSAFFEFFEIASELWFLIIAIDLWISIMNPFSSTKTWMWRYHLFVWSVSFAFAIPTLLLKEIYGFWYIDLKVDNTPICWIEQHKFKDGRTSMYPWIMFYGPLIIVYGFSVVVLIVAYRRLRHGISDTIIHRMKALVINSINVTAYMLYWAVLLVFLGLAFILTNTNSQRWMLRTLVFLISAKGISAVCVWVLTVDVHFGKADKDNSSEESGVDLNSALRQEVLYYATTGIRYCASLGADSDVRQDSIVVHLQQKQEKTVTKDLSIWFFIFLILGRDQERSQVARLAQKSRKKSTVRPAMTIEDALRSESGSIISSMDNRTSDSDVTRLSQRPTMVAGSVVTNPVSKFSIPESAPPTETASQPPLRRPFDPGFSEHDGISLSDLGKMPSGGAKDAEDHRFTSEVSMGRQSEMIVTTMGKRHPRGEWRLSTCKEMVQEFFAESSPDVEFVEFQPYHFRRVRIAAGVSENEYINQFSTTIKERLTQGGASGAFFFFSRDEIFIAKSCTDDEIEVLAENAKQYADYLESEKGKNTFISKIYGAYLLRIYGTSLYFFVMNNLFYGKDEYGDNLMIHEKYDIKGSTVNRSAAPPFEGQSVTCRHCEQKYVYTRKKHKNRPKAKSEESAISSLGRTPSAQSGEISIDIDDLSSTNIDDSNRCHVTVSGQHEPSVILKDNDLKFKIRLPKKVARSLVQQLENDAFFLYDVGVMDYSLLVGVRNTEYEVRDDNGDLASSFRSIGRSSDGESDREDKEESNSGGESGSGKDEENGAIVSHSTQPTLFQRHCVNSNNLKPCNDPGAIVNPAIAGAVTRRLEVSRVVGPDSYQMGIIDFQQRWNIKKKLERFFKVKVKGEDSYGLSAIPPDIYRDRFINHIRDILDYDEGVSVNPTSRAVRAVSRGSFIGNANAV